MNDLTSSFFVATQLLLDFDQELAEIVTLSLQISGLAVVLATLVALPLGASVALFKFPGRGVLVAVLNAFMGLPPVVVGLVVYLLLSRAGPLGSAGLLYTPSAMVFAQCLLIIPIIAALTRQIIADLHGYYDEQLRSLRVSRTGTVFTLLWEGRFSLVTAVLAGFGRASAEVGAVIIVGGNINHVTRVMTTTIALETSRGNLALALGLGIVLIALILLVSLVGSAIQRKANRIQGV